MAYQQPPYQTTVMQQPVVVQPVVVPLYSGPRFMGNAGPAYLRNGAKLGSNFVPGACIMVMLIFGGFLSFVSLMILATTNWDMTFWKRFDMTLPPTVIPGIVIGTIGLVLLIISCHLCQTAKKNFSTGTGNTSGHVYSSVGQPGYGQPDTAPNPGNTSGHVYSNQGQPAVGKPVTAVAAPVYLPGQTGGAIYSQQHPGGFTGPMYPQGSTVTTVTYANAAPTNQQPQPGFANAPGGVPYPEPPPYSGPEKSFAPPEYNQQPAFAPPSYNS